jgi:hypothetical protein
MNYFRQSLVMEGKFLQKHPAFRPSKKHQWQELRNEHTPSTDTHITSRSTEYERHHQLKYVFGKGQN